MPVLNLKPVRSFLDYLKYEKRYSVHTITSYTNDLQDFFDFIEIQFGTVELSAIDLNMVRSWLAGLKDKKFTSKSINRKISTLRSFFKYQMRTGVLTASPAAQVITPKISRRLPVYVTEEDTKTLVANLGRASEDWKSLNAKMLISIFYATGMRVSELVNLKEKQVDTGRSQIRVLGKGNKERMIPVSPGILEAIKLYREEKNQLFEKPGDYLLVTEKGKKIYPKYAYLLVNKYLGEASTLDKKSPHVLRHTFATHLMNQGADLNAVKELLGHSSLAATQVYTHNTIGKLKDIHKKAHPKA